MRPSILRCLLAVGCLCASTQSWAADALPAAGTDARTLDGCTALKPMPWHLGDMWWDIGEAATKEEFQSLDLDFEIKGEVGPGVKLYIAPTGGSGGVASQNFYGGLQTDSWMNRTLAEPAEWQRRAIGRAAIFSTWDDRSLSSILPAPGGYFDSAGHEGDFISVRNKVAWDQGRYTYRVCRLSTEEIAGKKRAWIGAFVINHQSGQVAFVGALRLKQGDNLHLTKHLSAFVEIYGGRPSFASLPYGLEVTFMKPKVNGKTVAAAHAMEQFDPKLPDIMFTEAVGGDGRKLDNPKAAKPEEIAGLRFILGTQVVERQKRHNWVF